MGVLIIPWSLSSCLCSTFIRGHCVFLSLNMHVSVRLTTGPGIPRRPSGPGFPGGPWGPTGPVLPAGPSAPASPCMWTYIQMVGMHGLSCTTQHCELMKFHRLLTMNINDNAWSNRGKKRKWTPQVNLVGSSLKYKYQCRKVTQNNKEFFNLENLESIFLSEFSCRLLLVWSKALTLG